MSVNEQEPKRPKVALIGRPNVGKSTIFNRLIGKRQAIVHDLPGVTRDRHYGNSDWNGLYFEVIDTGGLEPKTDSEVLQAMRGQTELAIKEADLAILMTDSRDGMLPQDREIYLQLKMAEVPTLVAVNKIDGLHMEHLAAEFYALGVDELYPISGLHGIGVGDLLDAVVDTLREVCGAVPFHEEPEPEFEWNEDEVVEEEEEPPVPKIAVIGKPNVGKSTLINRLVGEERVLAFPIAGTTRDAIDVEVTFAGKPYLFIDTAGIRRQKYVKEKLEKITIHQSLDSLDRCDVALFLIDATEGVTEQDAKVAGFAHNKGRGLIILVNKWDQMNRTPEAAKEFEAELRRKMKFLHYVPVIFCSALTGLRIHKVFETLEKTIAAYRKRVPTGELNRFFEDMMRYHPPPLHRGRPIKFYYVSQVQASPPTFLISANQPNAAHVTYKRFIMNSLRGTFGFEGVPLRLVFRSRRGK